MTIPRQLILLKQNKASFFHLKVEKIEILNRKNQPCIQDSSYSFTDCVQVTVFQKLIDIEVYFRLSSLTRLDVIILGMSGSEIKVKNQVLLKKCVMILKK